MAAQAAPFPDGDTCFEPALVLIPCTMAAGLLLLPVSSAGPALVWPVTCAHRVPHAKLQELADFAIAHTQRPPGEALGLGLNKA